MKSNRIYHLLLMSLIVCCTTSAKNPLIKDIGMSDPHIRVFDDSLYLYCGHDDHPDDKSWVMKEWRVFQSNNLLDWEQVGTISTADNYMDDDSQDCWAGDAATRNGEYFFYFSDRKNGIGVMRANTPAGPFKDALGKALVSPMHDPTILIDDDEQKTPYLIYGDKEGGGFHVAQMNEDMISLTEAPRPIEITGKEWEEAPHWMDKNFLFKHKGKFYLSWGKDYAISENIYGPYRCVGAVGNGHHLGHFAHGSFFWWKGQFYHNWCYYLRPGYKYRETIITYCHFDKDGQIVTDTNFLDQHFEDGVGQYRSSWDTIEAEWFSEKSKDVEKLHTQNSNFVLSNLSNGSWVKFAHTKFDSKVSQLTTLLSKNQSKGSIEIRIDHLDGPVIGRLDLSKTKLDSGFKAYSCPLTEPTGTHDVFIVFSGDNTFQASMDFIRFK